MNKQELITRLCCYGYLQSDIVANSVGEFSVADGDLSKSILMYQHQFGLTLTGTLTDETIEELNKERFCSVPDVQAQAHCKWDTNTRPLPLLWGIQGGITGVSSDDLITAYTVAWARWEKVCNLKATYTSNNVNCNVLMTHGPIDRSGGTLAWSELPCGRDRRLTQKYDTKERWFIPDSRPTSGISLVAVAAHEIGHALGLDHLSGGNLMQPYYSAAIREPQAGDIRAITGLYGSPPPPPPKPSDPPPLPPTPNPVPEPSPGLPEDEKDICLRIGEVKYIGVVRRM